MIGNTDVRVKVGELYLKVKKLYDNAVLPKYATDGSAGLDLTVNNYRYLNDGYVKYETGIAVSIPEGYVGLLFPRSSIWKVNSTMANSVGVIDSDYRGEISVVLDCSWSSDALPYTLGDRFCQLVILPLPKVNIDLVKELDNTVRGTGGFGSTGY